jgi:hypothetical protein
MFGRSSARQIDDEPNWREKIADWRDSPPWVFERPEWLTESPAALLLLFVGTLLTLTSVMYLVVPADALPASLPGRWNAPATSSTTSTSTTTTTLPPAVKQAALRKIAAARQAATRKIMALPLAKRQNAFEWIKAVTGYTETEAAAQQILDAPPVPPTRRWANAFLAAVFAAGALVGAWVVSDTRGRRFFHR